MCMYVADVRAYIKVDKRLFSLQNVLPVLFVSRERKVFPLFFLSAYFHEDMYLLKYGTRQELSTQRKVLNDEIKTPLMIKITWPIHQLFVYRLHLAF